MILLKDEDVCPSSLAKYFHDLGAVVEERAHDIRIKRTNRVIPGLGTQTQITGIDSCTERPARGCVNHQKQTRDSRNLGSAFMRTLHSR